MSLQTRVVARVPDKRLVKLTNPQARGSSLTTDTAFLALACTDTEADFSLFAQQAYDDDEPTHVDVGVAGVILKLHERSGAPYSGSLERARKAWEERCRQLSRSSSRGRVLPATTSSRTPSVPSDGDDQPGFDRSRFEDLIPNAPPGSEES